MKKNFFSAIVVAFLFAETILKAEDLTCVIDAAVDRGEKKIVLENKTYFLDSPILLGVRHNGISLEGSPEGGTVISCGRQIENWEEVDGLWRARVDGETFVSSLYFVLSSPMGNIF